MSRSWGRLYAGTRNHRKIKILAQRLPSLWTYWYVLIDMAIEIDDGGWIYVAPDLPYTFKELAKELRIRREDHVKTLCKTFEELNLITISDKGILLNSFAERNYESDISTPRVQKYREKQKQAKKSETLHERSGNVSETHHNRKRTETDIDKDPPTPQGVDGRDYGKEFDEIFYPNYPRKVSRDRARKAYLSRGKKQELPPVEALVATLEVQKASPEWTKDGGKFIPYPATWINDGRWDDKPPEGSGGRYAKRSGHSIIEN